MATETSETMQARWKGTVDLASAVQAAPPKKDSGIDLSQYQDLLRRSQSLRSEGARETGFAFMVPQEGVKATDSRFRQAAAALNIGCAIEVSDPDENGNCRMVVEARNKKQVKPLTQEQKDARNAKRKATLAAKAAKATKAIKK